MDTNAGCVRATHTVLSQPHCTNCYTNNCAICHTIHDTSLVPFAHALPTTSYATVRQWLSSTWSYDRHHRCDRDRWSYTSAIAIGADLTIGVPAGQISFSFFYRSPANEVSKNQGVVKSGFNFRCFLQVSGQRGIKKQWKKTRLCEVWMFFMWA